MRIVTLSGGSGWHVQDLLRAAARVGVEVLPRHWRELGGAVGAGAGKANSAIRAGDLDLGEADAVLLRTMPPGSLEQIVFRMDLVHRLAAKGVRVVNPPRAIEIAVDKYLSLALMVEAGLPVPETEVWQRWEDAAGAFERLGGDVVVKPIFGSEGFGITRATDADTAARIFAALERIGSVIYLQRFIDHGGVDYRLLVLGGRVLGAMRRTREGDWRTNIARGGKGEAIAPDAAMERFAVAAARACAAEAAGVDIAIDRAGEAFVLEVNAVPGWRELTRVTGIDVAAEVLRHVASKAKA
ncbi:MAG: RimK family alpha-L-glutamate ligase [Planctomycetota bacterium]|nr:RimK family alpha-L-glutamate ligase [Planctomycetota bacterium]